MERSGRGQEASVQAEPGVLLSSAPGDALEVGESSEQTPRTRAVRGQEERMETALRGCLTFVKGPPLSQAGRRRL